MQTYFLVESVKQREEKDVRSSEDKPSFSLTSLLKRNPTSKTINSAMERRASTKALTSSSSNASDVSGPSDGTSGSPRGSVSATKQKTRVRRLGIELTTLWC